MPASRSQNSSVLWAVAGVMSLPIDLKQNSSVLWAVAGVVSLPIDLKQNSSVLWAVAGVVSLPIDLKQNWMCLWMPFSRQVQARSISFHIHTYLSFGKLFSAIFALFECSSHVTGVYCLTVSADATVTFNTMPSGFYFGLF